VDPLHEVQFASDKEHVTQGKVHAEQVFPTNKNPLLQELQ
jgi:hypothetical protein